jgi:hypothetical protein
METSHRHEGNGFLTLNAFIENVNNLRCSFWRRKFSLRPTRNFYGLKIACDMVPCGLGHRGEVTGVCPTSQLSLRKICGPAMTQWDIAR